ncbi:hypothetical protein ACHAQJ_003169 [Trichoderma viride]
MSDAFSSANGAMGIISLGLTIAQGLFQIADGIGSAGQEVRGYGEEINTFAKLLKHVRTELESSNDVSVDIQSLINDVVDICDRVLQPFNGLQKMLNPLLDHFRSSPNKLKQLGNSMAAVSLSYRATQRLDFKISFEESSPNTLATTTDLQPDDETIHVLLERASDGKDSHEGDPKYDAALVRLSTTLNDSGGEELSEQTALILDRWIESHLDSESQESAQEIWYDICALQRKVLRLASRRLQSGSGFGVPINKPNSKDYTVGWICTGKTEYVAARAFLDANHEALGDIIPPDDANTYTLGMIGDHYVVVTVVADQDLVTAAAVANDMRRSFPNLKIGLLVGIGGGVPSERHDIRLGDVVVSAPRQGMGAVTQCNTDDGNEFRKVQITGQPPVFLRAAAAGLQAKHEADGSSIKEAIAKVLDGNPRLRMKYSRPDPSSDRLYLGAHPHVSGQETCCACGDLSLVLRNERTWSKNELEVHFGLIASANKVIEDSLTRDQLAADKDFLCFDTVAAGVMNHFPCLVIHGIYNYADSHRNNEWAAYAAMAAAAYAKQLLYHIPPKGGDY